MNVGIYCVMSLWLWGGLWNVQLEMMNSSVLFLFYHQRMKHNGKMGT